MGPMRKILIRLATVVTITGSSMTFTAVGDAVAQPVAQEPSQLARLVGADLGTILSMVPAVFCGNRLVNYNSPSSNSPTKCVNGAENSGNSTNSGNYHSEGNPINSGNFSNVNGSTNSNNATDSGNIANGSQSLR
ncbi:hypothetical protein SAMN05421811_103478 [Nonomuraea wenchangensis]|uniref:Uncharacterized protein n=2 Tax=Nonomuraea wenchangensis TaxID=568860 RepID=A0A1I0FHT6_9ACTN|nr:hypothetical protein SAMN05421811_103478 [Nonomuraea wenchangensis]